MNQSTFGWTSTLGTDRLTWLVSITSFTYQHKWSGTVMVWYKINSLKFILLSKLPASVYRWRVVFLNHMNMLPTGLTGHQLAGTFSHQYTEAAIVKARSRSANIQARCAHHYPIVLPQLVGGVAFTALTSHLLVAVRTTHPGPQNIYNLHWNARAKIHYL